MVGTSIQRQCEVHVLTCLPAAYKNSGDQTKESKVIRDKKRERGAKKKWRRDKIK